MSEPILPIPGVPEELLRVLNARFRDLPAAAPAAAAPAAAVVRQLPLDTVRGAGALTHIGAVPKVGGSGAVVESAIVDDGTNVTIAARSLGVGGAPNVSAGAVPTVTAFSETAQGRVEAATGQAQTANALVGEYDFCVRGSTVPRLAVIRSAMEGVSAINIGGRISIFTKADNGALTEWVRLSSTGKAGFGGNLNPQYAVDATGDVNASGVMRVGGAGGLTASRTVVTSVAAITTSLQYKDWTGANASTSIQQGNSVSTTTHGFSGGVLTL